MTPRLLVEDLKALVTDEVETELHSFEDPGERPPEHLKRFSQWYRDLAEQDREIVGQVMRFSSEGALFALLAVLEELATFSEENGSLELWYVSPEGDRSRLNDPDQVSLTDLFNSLE